MRQWKLREHDNGIMSAHYSVGRSKQCSTMLAQRGVGLDQSSDFFECKWESLASPSSFGPGMSIAATILIDVCSNGGMVAIIGDYDADGVLSAAIMARLTTDLGGKPVVFLPDRIEHGYGLNSKTLDAFSKSRGSTPKLSAIFVVDSGSSENDHVLSMKKEYGCPVVVIDHHIIGNNPAVSADAHVNWHIEGENMCAAGECFMLAREVCSRIGGNELRYACLAAIATVADMVPILGSNRILVRHGLQMAEESGCYGLQQMCMSVCDGEIFQKDVSFKIAPRINSVGRLGSAHTALNLFLTKNPSEVVAILKEMESANKARKVIQKSMEMTALLMIEQNPSLTSNGIFLYCDTWNPGVCGIACNQIVSKTGLPCMLFGLSDGKIKGSGRSVPGVRIKEIMDACSHLFVRYGGHDMACGAELKPEFVESEESFITVTKTFDDACLKFYEENGRPDLTGRYDAEIPIEKIESKNAAALTRTFYPYSEVGNPEPIFKASGVELVGVRAFEHSTGIVTRFKVVKDSLTSPMEFLSFDPELVVNNGDKVDVYYNMPQCSNEIDDDWGSPSRKPSVDIVEVVKL